LIEDMPEVISKLSTAAWHCAGDNLKRSICGAYPSGGASNCRLILPEACFQIHSPMTFAIILLYYNIAD